MPHVSDPHMSGLVFLFVVQTATDVLLVLFLKKNGILLMRVPALTLFRKKRTAVVVSSERWAALSLGPSGAVL